MKTLLKILKNKNQYPLKEETCLRDIMDNHKKKRRYELYKSTGWVA
jgi:hypothetical protein